jgi:N-dimethylarginine dimethylaminohydrolase
VIEPGTVVLASGNPRVRNALTDRGIEVIELDAREIRKTGGGLKGLVLPLSRS